MKNLLATIALIVVALWGTAVYRPAPTAFTQAVTPTVANYLPVVLRDGIETAVPPTATATNTPTATSSPTATNTATPTNTPTVTNTPTATNTPTNTPTATNTATATNTPTATSTPTSTPTATNTATATATATNTATATATATPVTSTSGDVRVTFIFADGAGQNEPNEYVRIQNFDSRRINLSGWTLRDNANHIFTFPNYTLEPGETCRVYTNEDHPEWCGFNYHSSSAIWNNTGDCAFLRNSAGTLIDEYCY